MNAKNNKKLLESQRQICQINVKSVIVHTTNDIHTNKSYYLKRSGAIKRTAYKRQRKYTHF